MNYLSVCLFQYCFTAGGGGGGHGAPAFAHADLVRIVDAEILQFRAAPDLPRCQQVVGGYHFPNPLEWWSQHENKFPILAELAREYLACPATSAPSERLFSISGLTIANDRASLLPDTAAEIVFCRANWVIANEHRRELGLGPI